MVVRCTAFNIFNIAHRHELVDIIYVPGTVSSRLRPVEIYPVVVFSCFAPCKSKINGSKRSADFGIVSLGMYHQCVDLVSCLESDIRLIAAYELLG